LSDEIREVLPPSFSKTLSLPTICEALTKAAYDPRIKGLFVKIEPVDCGWAKLMEIRRHLEFFNASGKFSVAYIESGGEKEYFVASAFQEIYVPPSANVYLRGLSVSGTFVRGALDKVGIEPQVKRIGNYKSAGDQLLREEMSAYQKEQLQALLDDIYNGFTKEVARSRDMSVESVEKALDEGYISMEEYQRAGFFTDLKYKDEVIDMLKERLEITNKKSKLKRLSLKRYKSVSPSAFGLNKGKKVLAIVRASGAISSSDGVMSNTGPSISAKEVIREIRKAAEMKNVVAIVLRVDSPGGEALASDLMWREIQQVARDKPVVASMADLAASGGYYMAMAAKKIVAEPLTLTGSIGVVLGKIGLGELYKRIGIGKEILSKGRYAEVLAENRSFTEDEDTYFTKLAGYAYTSFRDKAAESRGLTPDQMQEYAQGRVWSGTRAAEIGLVDAIGGIHRAIALAKQCAGLEDNERVKILEISRTKGSPLDMIRSIGAATNVIVSVLFLGWGIVSFAISHEGFGFINAVISIALGSLGLLSSIPEGDDQLWEYTMEDVGVNDTKLQGFLPQAIMDTDNLFVSNTLKPALVQLLKRLL